MARYYYDVYRTRYWWRQGSDGLNPIEIEYYYPSLTKSDIKWVGLNAELDLYSEYVRSDWTLDKVFYESEYKNNTLYGYYDHKGFLVYQSSVGEGDIGYYAAHSYDFRRGIYLWELEVEEIYYEDGERILRCRGLREGSLPKDEYERGRYSVFTISQYLGKGDYVKTIIAEDGAYPDDGIQGDYWYVKGERAFPEMYAKIDGIQKVAEDGWVKIDGVLRPIQGIWTKIDGQLKQS